MLRVHRRECVACEARSIRKTLIGCNGTQTATPATVDWDGVTVTECCHAVLMRSLAALAGQTHQSHARLQPRHMGISVRRRVVEAGGLFS